MGRGGQRMSFDDRRRALISQSGGFALPVFSGSHTIHGDVKKGYIKLLGNGTLTLAKGTYDIFLVGGGAGGGNNHTETNGTGTTDYCAGNGGNGGGILTKTGLALEGDYSVTIGAGGSVGAPTTSAVTKLGSYKTSGTSAAGGTAGYQRPVYYASYAPKKGTDGVYPFGDSGFENYRYGAGGGGGGINSTQSYHDDDHGYGASGGASGGGTGATRVGQYTSTGESKKATAGAANSGGGGGGQGVYYSGNTWSASTTAGAKGGSGIAIVRWGY